MEKLTFSPNLHLTKVDKLSSLDLRKEATKHHTAEMWQTNWYNAAQLELLWLPATKRAGIAWGAEADWTDASSPEDALQRFFNDDMIN